VLSWIIGQTGHPRKGQLTIAKASALEGSMVSRIATLARCSLATVSTFEARDGLIGIEFNLGTLTLTAPAGLVGAILNELQIP
jgi:hypothetical protein